jgi:secreted trypsin-like serine protease
MRFLEKNTGPLILALATLSCGKPAADQMKSSLDVLHGQLVEDERDPIFFSTAAITTDSQLSQGKSFCTGTLIGPRLIVTAAHCLLSYNNELNLKPTYPIQKLRIVFGKRVNEKSAQVHEALLAVTHPIYSPYSSGLKEPGSPPNDLALIYLKKEATAPRVVRRLDPNTDYPEGQDFLVAGFGSAVGRSEIEKAGEKGGILRKAIARVFSGSDASDQEPYIESQRIPVGLSASGEAWATAQGACLGDSGGPLYRRAEDGEFYIRGVLSAGVVNAKGQCTGRAVYTDLSYYSSWLERSTSRLEQAAASLKEGYL